MCIIRSYRDLEVLAMIGEKKVFVSALGKFKLLELI